MCLCFRDTTHGMKAKLGWEQGRSPMFAGALRVSVGVSGAGWKESRGTGTHKQFTRSFSVLSLFIAGTKPSCSYAVLCGAGTQGFLHAPPSPGWHLGVFCCNCAHSSAHTCTYTQRNFYLCYILCLFLLCCETFI